MSIPKIIYQTYSSADIPYYAKIQIWIFRHRNRDFRYMFYDDHMIDKFIKENFNEAVYKAYSKVQIGAAKADFFRYAILYKNGGIYLDIDSSISNRLNTKINTTQSAIIAREKTNKNLYVQWALIFEKNHPILKHTLNIIVDNIMKNKYSNNVIYCTGPVPYSIAVEHYLNTMNEDDRIELVEDNYKGIFKFKTILARIYEIKKKKKHWRQIQQLKTVYKIM